MFLYNGTVHGLLIANTGSPNAPTPAALRRYLAHFLSDPRIIEFPRWIWLPVLHGVILNVRPRRSARLYQRVWTADGSPLLASTQKLAAGLQIALPERTGALWQVVAGMRYGEPSIAAGLRRLRDAGADTLTVLPLFPQYSATTTASIFDAVFAELHRWRHVPPLHLINGYHDHPAYIGAVRESLCAAWQPGGPPERLLFSFHGIPQSYAAHGDPYPRQCRRTAELIVAGLDLDPQAWQVTFQSRFGPQEWLQPYTDRTLAALGAHGLGRLDVACPGFAVDCLETLDEIAHEGRKTYQNAGGERFEYIPALNATPAHVAALADILS